MNNQTPIRLPGSNDRTVVIGRTGSGKSYYGIWLLSKQPLTDIPWVIIDSKNDQSDLINNIDRAQLIGYDEIPQDPGIYILKMKPGETELVSDWLEQVLQQGNCGVFVDEAYMLGRNNEGLNACLTQGRSLRIPMIILTQRPAFLSMYVMSESGYFQVFDLVRKKDRQRIAEDLPIDVDYELPDHHSIYYSVSDKRMAKFNPVPDGNAILAAIDEKLAVLDEQKPKRRAL